MIEWPPLNVWPWLNLECRGCKWAHVLGVKDHGQIYHEAKCTNGTVVDWLIAQDGIEETEKTVLLDRPCKLYKKQRATSGKRTVRNFG